MLFPESVVLCMYFKSLRTYLFYNKLFFNHLKERLAIFSGQNYKNMNIHSIKRQSNMELLRCFAMLCIILYHMLCFVVSPMNPNNVLYKAMWMPLHIGVPLFVMISGYFGIRFSLRGLMRFCSKVYIYIVPISIIFSVFICHEGIKTILKQLFIFGYGFNEHWYLNVYLYLFLFSPIINKYLEKSTFIQRIYILVILFFMSIYVGNIKANDWNLIDGKNITNFIFLYVIGNTIRKMHHRIENISSLKLIVGIFLLNFMMVISYIYLPSISNRIWTYGFSYCGPLLIINSILVFLLFCKLNFHSRFTNWAAGGIFACYLWQCLPTWNAYFMIPLKYFLSNWGGYISIVRISVHDYLCNYTNVHFYCIR